MVRLMRPIIKAMKPIRAAETKTQTAALLWRPTREGVGLGRWPVGAESDADLTLLDLHLAQGRGRRLPVARHDRRGAQPDADLVGQVLVGDEVAHQRQHERPEEDVENGDQLPDTRERQGTCLFAA